MQAHSKKFSSLTQRLVEDTGDAWEIHNRGLHKKAAGEPVIMLSIGQEEDEVTPAHIVDSAKEALSEGRHHYTPAAGEPLLREAIARHHSLTTRQQVTADQVTVHSGAQNALFAIAQCLLEPGDEVILSEPYYTTYPATFTASGAKAVCLSVNAETGFLPDPANIVASINSRTRAIVLNSPSNPLGTIYTKEIFEPIIQACEKNNIWLVSDEVYSGLLSPERRLSPASIPGASDHVVTVSSLSKSHRMTGWRVGWAVSPEPLATHLAKLSMAMHYGLPPFIMDAAVTAINEYQQGEDTAQLIRAALAERRDILKNALHTGPTVELYDSGYGMFILLDVRETGMTAHDFAAGLLEEQLVSTLPCSGFGPSGKYLLRVGLCVDGKELATAGEKITRYIKAL